MIEAIETIKNLGIFSDYKKTGSCPNFRRYNLIYGLNGTGKTTLSRFFSDLKSGEALGFPDLSYKLKMKNNTRVKNGEIFPDSIYVFNSDYIEKNVGSCEGELNPIYILGETSNDLLPVIQQDERTVALLKEKILEADEEISTQTENRNKIFKKIAAQIKDNIPDKKWRNYNQTKAKAAFVDGRNLDSIIIADYQNALSSLTQTSLPILEKIFIPNSFDDLKVIKLEVNSICKESATSKAIDSLVNQPDLLSWVEDGIKFHKANSFEKCKFCEQPFPADRKQKIEDHFNTSDSDLKVRIELTRTKLSALTGTLPISFTYKAIDFYHDFQLTAEEARKLAIAAQEEVFKCIDTYIAALDDKLQRRTESYQLHLPELDIQKFKDALAKYNSIIEANNKKTTSYSEHVNKFQTTIESYILGTIVDEVTDIDKSLVQLNSDKELYQNGDETKPGITDLQLRIQKSNTMVSDSHKGAQQLSDKLTSFLGRDELKFEQEDKGYRITRYGRPAQRLSEGEKTAVAFIYFTTTLSAKDFNLGESILVIDDPISSFDSNSVYQAFGFLKSETKGAKQVFYLTHNFAFLKLMINWLTGTRNNKDLSSFWMLKCTIDQMKKRSSSLVKLDETLQKSKSEISYIFKIVYDYYENPEHATIENTYQMPNLIRKLLESFLNHHQPRASTQVQLEKLPFDEQKRTALNKYANDLSHSTMSDIDPAIIPETQTNIGHLFEMMETIAPEYFKALKYETTV